MSDAEEAKQPIEFFRFNPNDVYGSYKHSELKDKTVDHDETPVVNEILNSQRKMSSELEIFGIKDSKMEGDSKDDSDDDDRKNISQGLYAFTQPLREEGLKEEGLTEDSYANMFFHKEEIHHLDIIRLRAYFGYYHDLTTLYNDVMKLLKTTLSNKCGNVLSKYYISDIIHKVQTLFTDKQRRIEFRRLYKQDYEYKYDVNKLITVEGKWDKKPGPQRKYIRVEEYVPVVSDNTLERMNTSKTSQCTGDCCDTYEKLGTIAVTEDHWVSN